jgi:predicted ATP-dependent protease
MDASAGSDERWRLRPAQLGVDVVFDEPKFRTTNELAPLDQVVGQERALRALGFGLAVRHRGYNVFVCGMSGAGRKELLAQLLQERAAREPTPDDWIYVHNFDEPDHPLALRLPSGHGVKLRAGLAQAIERLCQDLPAALKAKDFGAERVRLAALYGQRSEALFAELAEHAARLQLAVRRMPDGALLFVPLKEGKPLAPEQLEHLTGEERADIDRRNAELSERASEILTRQQELSRQLREEVEQIVRSFARHIFDPLIDRLKLDYPDDKVVRWLERVREHVLSDLQWLQGEQEEDGAPPGLPAAIKPDPWLECRVNVVADNARTSGAPVVIELSPNYKNLFGAIEHDVNLFGRVSTDFTRIKPGSLLRANGGYLIFDLGDAVTEPFVWKQLKRTIQSGQLLTDGYEPFALVAPGALQPQPIPIDTKLVVLGPPDLYYTLQFLDEDFRELFKVRSDFGPDMPRDAGGQRAYAAFIARQVSSEGLAPFDESAVAEVIRFGARQAGDQQKLSVEFAALADLVRESSYWARSAGAAVVAAAHVRQAQDEQARRGGRLADRIRELIAQGILRVSLQGRAVGQVNGLAVLDLGDVRFGRPSRVTASAGVGQEGIVNIERESALSGSTHNKGVLILEGYLRNRYARLHPLAVSASLAFEQSYGWIEGDSASSPELYCLLSALAGVPLRQDVAVTGSVNQHGEIQAVGGINEKVEGFFDVCRSQGMTGTQGVCIPRSNVRHLVLRDEVIQAVASGTFHVWSVDSVDEGIELLTGVAAGGVDQEGTFHFRVDQQLREFLRLLQEQPAATAPARVHLTPGSAPKTPPPLPGD